MDKLRYALITGANGGIGRALCSAFSTEGYQVIAVDLHDKAQAELIYSHYIQADLARFVFDEQYAVTTLNQIKALLPSGQLHCLVNNAAIQILGGVENLTRNDWQQSLAVNLQAPFFLVQSLLAELESVKGSVINISSIHARLTKKNFVAYASSKAALTGMTKAMALDIGGRIRVNAIEPAAIETDMLRAGFSEEPEKYKLLVDYHPSKVIGKPDEVARLAVFICASENHFMHGSCIGIDGAISSVLHDPN